MAAITAIYAAIQRHIKMIVAITVFILIVLLAAIFFIVTRYVDPPFKGFFCDDPTIRYPFTNRITIPVWGLVVIISIVPLLIVCSGTLLEFIFSKCQSNTNVSTSSKKKWYTKLLPPFIWFMWYIMGLCFTGILTAILKISLGELRPYFLAVCNPNMTAINCFDEAGYPLYVTEYACRGDPGMIREARQSFPSGHASAGAFSMIYIAFYISSLSFIHSRSPFQFLLLLIFAILFPSLVGIIRINDYHHHPHDVLWGIILGGSIALIVVYFNLHYFVRNKHHPLFGQNSTSLELQDKEKTVDPADTDIKDDETQP